MSYQANDIVTVGGSAYIATRPPTGAPPADPAWSLLVSKGDTGATGDPGTKGDPGPQGIQGPAGPAAAAVTCTSGSFISAISGAGQSTCTTPVLVQDAFTVYGTAPLNVTGFTFADVPGLTQTITVPVSTNGYVVEMITTGGVEPTANCAFASCSVQVDIQVMIDGQQARGTFERISALDNAAIWAQPTAFWSTAGTFALAAGSHTLKVQGRLAGSNNAPFGANVSAGDNTTIQGQLTVVLLRR